MHGQRCPVFLYRPGLAVYPSGGLHWVCWVPTLQKYTPVGPTIRHHSCPSEAMNNTFCGTGMSTVCSTKKGTVGTSTNCSASCGSQRTVRCGMASCEILGTSITCSGTELSKSLSTSTSWSTICGTGASRSSIGTGTKDSIICSAVCRWIRSCGPRGSTRPVGRNPPGSSSKSWKSSGWGGGVVRNLAVYFVLALLLPGPGHLRALCAVVQLLGQGHSDGLPLMPQDGAEPSLSPPPCGACGDACTRAIRWVRNHHGHTERKRVLESYALLLLFWMTLTHVSVHTRKIQKALLASCTTGGLTPGSSTPGVSATPEPSMTENSSSSKAPQLRRLALNSGTTQRSAKNAEKPTKNIHRRHPRWKCIRL